MHRIQKIVHHLSDDGNIHNDNNNNNNTNVNNTSSHHSSNSHENGNTFFAVMDCGPSPVTETYGQMIQNLLELKHKKNETWKSYTVYENEFPTFEEMSSFSAIVLSGSKHDSFDNTTPFIARLQRFIVSMYAHPQLQDLKWMGICFGHQILAHVLGGHTHRNTKAFWDHGVRTVSLTPAFHAMFDENSDYDNELRLTLKKKKSLNICESHRDAVLKLPTNAKLLAHSSATDVEIYAIGDRVLAFQGHPEFAVATAMATLNKNASVSRESFLRFKQTMEDGTHMPDSDIWKGLVQTWIRCRRNIE